MATMRMPTYGRYDALSGPELLHLADEAVAAHNNEQAAELIALAFAFFDKNSPNNCDQTENIDRPNE